MERMKLASMASFGVRKWLKPPEHSLNKRLHC